jgi:divalent metal cation (Fe/Co/Zn/Cd) transporter
MADFVQIEARPGARVDAGYPELGSNSRGIIRLQLITVAWMLVECGVALISSSKAHSPALLAFGSDSFVELLSAGVVLLQFAPSFTLSPPQAARWSGALLFFLAAIVAFTSLGALILGIQPATSWIGIAVTVAALLIMPVLSRAKRRGAYVANNRALSADAVQSATCAYLAGITLCGLAINAVFHLRWIDPLAALFAIPIICLEATRALRGDPCQCC